MKNTLLLKQITGQSEQPNVQQQNKRPHKSHRTWVKIVLWSTKFILCIVSRNLRLNLKKFYLNIFYFKTKNFLFKLIKHLKKCSTSSGATLPVKVNGKFESKRELKPNLNANINLKNNYNKNLHCKLTYATYYNWLNFLGTTKTRHIIPIFDDF